VETISSAPLTEEQRALAALAEQTEQYAMRAMCHAYKGAIREGEVYYHCFSEQVCGLFAATDLLFVNRLMIGAANELTEELLGEALAYYRSRNCTRMMLHVPPVDFTDAHQALLQRKGGRLLNHWVKHITVPSPQSGTTSGITVRPARKEEYGRLGIILQRAFDWPVSLLKFCQEGLGKGNWQPFAAEMGNEIIATGSLYAADRIAALGVGATLPEFQRHGAQGALIRARINEAFNQGCRLVFSETIEPGEKNRAPSWRNMQRYGFHQLYRRTNYIFEFRDKA
jgi:GNAT superfamily N-acetyltransferase